MSIQDSSKRLNDAVIRRDTKQRSLKDAEVSFKQISEKVTMEYNSAMDKAKKDLEAARSAVNEAEKEVQNEARLVQGEIDEILDDQVLLKDKTSKVAFVGAGMK